MYCCQDWSALSIFLGIITFKEACLFLDLIKLHLSDPALDRCQEKVEGVGSSGTIKAETEDSKFRMRILFICIIPKGVGTARDPSYRQVPCDFLKHNIPSYICSVPYPLSTITSNLSNSYLSYKSPLRKPLLLAVADLTNGFRSPRRPFLESVLYGRFKINKIGDLLSIEKEN